MNQSAIVAVTTAFTMPDRITLWKRRMVTVLVTVTSKKGQNRAISGNIAANQKPTKHEVSGFFKW
jgi:hypothetical protein